MGWSGNGLRVLGITLMPPSGNPRLSRCAAVAAKIEKLSQTVRPSLGWDEDSKCGPSLARHCSAWTRRPHVRRRAREDSSFAISTPLPRLRARSIPEAGRGTGYRAF